MRRAEAELNHARVPLLIPESWTVFTYKGQQFRQEHGTIRQLGSDGRWRRVWTRELPALVSVAA